MSHQLESSTGAKPQFLWLLRRRDSFDIEVIQSFFVDAYKISHPEGLKSKLIILVRDVHDAGTKKSQKNTERLILRKLEKLWMSCRQVLYSTYHFPRGA